MTKNPIYSTTTKEFIVSYQSTRKQLEQSQSIATGNGHQRSKQMFAAIHSTTIFKTDQSNSLQKCNTPKRKKNTSREREKRESMSKK